MLFRRIVFYALLVGGVSGSLLTVVQFWQVIPIIQSAEHFESKPVVVSGHAHAGHEHPAGAWKPADGIERTAFTLLSNVLMGIGFALLVLAAILISRRLKTTINLDWRYGLLWGAVGYSIFFLAPALGVPPEIPGAIAAPLEDRQLWWLLAVVFTSAGFSGVAFGKSPWRWAAICLFIVPYLVGAPSTPTEVLTNQSPAVIAELEVLASQFISATAIANACFWLALGLVSVWAVRQIMTHSNELTAS